MAIIITLGKTPKHFKRFPVKVALPDGAEGTIGVTFKYRTRAGFGEYLNSLYASSDTIKPDDGEKPDFVAIFAKGGEKSVTQLMDAIESWDLDHELNKDTLAALQNEAPGVIAAIGEAYRSACVEGRLGN